MSHIASFKTFAAAVPFSTTLEAAGRWLDETLLALHAALCDAADEATGARTRDDGEGDDR